MYASIFPFLCLSLAMILVGSSVVVGKVMVAELPVHLASALRFILALAVLAPLLRFREGGVPRISRRSWALMAAQSLCGSYLFTVFLLYGLKRTSPAAAGVIAATTPACMGLIAWLFFGERPGPRIAAGVLLSVFGVLAVNLAAPDSGGASGAPHPLAGNLLVLCAVGFESLFLLLRKTVPEPLSPLAVSTIISFFGLLWFLPGALLDAASCNLSAVGPSGWLAVAYYGLFVTALAYLFWFAGVVRVRASVAGGFTAVMPVSALVLSAVFLGEDVGPAQLAGCVLVLAGVLLLARPPARAR